MGEGPVTVTPPPRSRISLVFTCEARPGPERVRGLDVDHIGKGTGRPIRAACGVKALPQCRASRGEIDTADLGKAVDGTKKSAFAEFVGNLHEGSVVNDLQPTFGQARSQCNPAFLLGNRSTSAVGFLRGGGWQVRRGLGQAVMDDAEKGKFRWRDALQGEGFFCAFLGGHCKGCESGSVEHQPQAARSTM